MGISGPSGGFTDPAAAQMQWDAIASIRSMSPFADAPQDAGSGIAAALDALMPAMPAGPDAGAGAAPGLDIEAEIRQAQQVTIDLFA